MSDIEHSNWSETAGSNTTTPPNGFPEGALPSTVNDGMREVMGAVKREWNRSHPTVTSGGSATAYTLTYGTAPAAYVAGQIFAFKAHAANTGAATLNVNSLGAVSIKKNDGSTDLAAGDIALNEIVEVAYNGTVFVLRKAMNFISAATAAATYAPLANPALTGSPTAPTPSSGDISTKIATTAFVNPAASLASNGYYRFANGLILQWGAVTATTTATNTSFPLTFPTACLQIVISPNNAGTNGVSAGIVSASQFVTQTATGSVLSRWVAVGY